MSCGNAMRSALGSATFSVGATAVSLWDGSAASGSNIKTLEYGADGQSSTGKKVKGLWVTPRSGAARYYLGSGATLSATAGHPLAADQTLYLDVDPRSVTFISQSGTITLDVDYIGD